MANTQGSGCVGVWNTDIQVYLCVCYVRYVDETDKLCSLNKDELIGKNETQMLIILKWKNLFKDVVLFWGEMIML